MKDLARRVALLFLAGFIAHGAGLLLHELVGHGLTAVAFGGSLEDMRFSFFGHGWIAYREAASVTTLARLCIDWGGIVVTFLAGALLLVGSASFSRPRLKLAALFAATLWLLQPLFYCVLGAYHELDDPARTVALLGGRAKAAWLWGGALACYAAVAFAVSPRLLRAYAAAFPSASRRALAGSALLALAISGVIYLGAFLGEGRLRGDIPSGITARAFARAEERVAVRVQRETVASGVMPLPARVQEIARAEQPFPIGVLLALGNVLALAFALWRLAPLAEPAPCTERPNRVLVALALCTAVLLFLCDHCGRFHP